jgi:hypothetical protein
VKDLRYSILFVCLIILLNSSNIPIGYVESKVISIINFVEGNSVDAESDINGIGFERDGNSILMAIYVTGDITKGLYDMDYIYTVSFFENKNESWENGFCTIEVGFFPDENDVVCFIFGPKTQTPQSIRKLPFRIEGKDMYTVVRIESLTLNDLNNMEVFYVSAATKLYQNNDMQFVDIEPRHPSGDLTASTNYHSKLILQEKSIHTELSTPAQNQTLTETPDLIPTPRLSPQPLNEKYQNFPYIIITLVIILLIAIIGQIVYNRKKSRA